MFDIETDILMNQPIIAWHFITDSNWNEAEDSYRNIVEKGSLTAAAYRENPLLQELDVLAGDDQFLFLSLYPHVTNAYFPERNLDSFPPRIWGFGFSAIDLVYDFDAAIRREDYLHEYNVIAEKVKQEMREMGWDTTDYFDINKQFQLSFEELFFEEAQLFQEQNQVTGSQAIDYLMMVTEDCYTFRTTPLGELSDSRYQAGTRICNQFQRTEVIVPEELPVSEALIFVDDGELSWNLSS